MPAPLLALAALQAAVSNRGLRPNLVGTPAQLAERMQAFAAAGLDLFLIQCSPVLEEIERSGRQVLTLLGTQAAVTASAQA